MSEATMRAGVLAAYRTALIDALSAAVVQTRERWIGLHGSLAPELIEATDSLLGEIDELYGPTSGLPAADPRREEPWDVETIAQEYIADINSWPPSRRDALPPHIREAVSKRVQELRSRPRVLDDITHGGADLALPREDDDEGDTQTQQEDD